jgi:endonuclease I
MADGQQVTVRGTVTRAMGRMSYVQDATAAIAVYATSGAWYDAVGDGTVASGCDVELTAVLDTYNGLTELKNVSAFTVHATGVVLPAPATVTLAEIAASGEPWESELIRVEELETAAFGTFAASTTYSISDPTDSSGTVSLRVPSASDTEVDGTTIPGSDFIFEGVLGQFTYTGSGGYQLSPVEATDIDGEGGGWPSLDGYWDSAEGLAGAALRAELHDIIAPHAVVSYSATHDAIDQLDEAPGDATRVQLLYSTATALKSSWPAYNREHSWPQSLGPVDGTAGNSDLHHIFPCDADVNSDRGNLPFGECDHAGCGAVSEAPDVRTDGIVWEPPGYHKGDVARAMFYMDVRYEGDLGDPDLVLGNTGTSSGCDCMAALQDLLYWHRLDPPDTRERARHDGIFFDWQGNRNPFIDHPEWVLEVFACDPALAFAGDVDGDCRWDARDLAEVVRWIDDSGGTPPAGHLDCDGALGADPNDLPCVVGWVFDPV